MLRPFAHLVIIVLLTVVTQIGGVVWFAALFIARGRGRLVFFAVAVVLYGAAWGGARVVAPMFGRQAIPCFQVEPGQPSAAHPFFCLANRTYVTPDLARHLDGLGVYMETRFPGTHVRVLDGGFPFGSVPLLPHLSHGDGRKVDLALWYEGGGLRSPIGYFAFEQPESGAPELCGQTRGLTLRWDLAWFQPLWPENPLDETRTGAALSWLAQNAPLGGKVFVEPHLVRKLGDAHSAIRFQGCRAARHDDHIHVQI